MADRDEFSFPDPKKSTAKLEASLASKSTVVPGSVVGIPDAYEARWCDPTMTSDRIAQMRAIYEDEWGGVEMPLSEQRKRGVYVAGCPNALVWVFPAGLERRLLEERRRLAEEDGALPLHAVNKRSLHRR